MTDEQLRDIISNLESDRIERTISTTNTDKFGQAICAFANDLAGHNAPGYLVLGVEDDGTVKGIDVTDELLKNIAAIRTDGNIQPQPSMSVERKSLAEGDIILVTVQPAQFPPVRYKGRVWVRIGPRRGVANENDEHILLEKRRANVTAFDAAPCLNATLEDLDISLFKHYFLPKAMPEDVLEEDKRDITVKLSSFGFYDLRANCPTHAGVLFFAKQLRRFIPGAYVQYVRFAGADRASDIMTEHEFKENLCTILPELDTFIKTTIANRRPIPVSAAREENVVDYPDWATRELLMNAICHRDYSSNGPIQFYQYDDHIEITNHGGLYGRANAENFPNVNDYRNVVVAEAMKVLGFVNRHSRGVMKVQKDLLANENGQAIYDFEYQTAVSVRENKSPRGDRMMQEAIQQGFAIEESESKTLKNEGKGSQKRSQKRSFLTVLEFPSDVVKNVYETIKLYPKAKYSYLADNLGVSEATIKRSVQWLKENGYINAEHSKVKGVWQLIEKEDK